MYINWLDKLVKDKVLVKVKRTVKSSTVYSFTKNFKHLKIESDSKDEHFSIPAKSDGKLHYTIVNKDIEKKRKFCIKTLIKIKNNIVEKLE